MAKAVKHNLSNLLDEVNAQLRKDFHKRDIITERADRELETPTLWASTGSLALDRLIRGRNPGGIPMGPRYGRVVHLFGDPSTAKSLIAYHVGKSVIEMGGLVNVSENEATMDPYFPGRIELDTSRTNIQKPEDLNEMFDFGLKWHAHIRAKAPTIPLLWIIDSLDSSEAAKARDKGLTESGAYQYGGGKSELLGAGLKRVNNLMCSRYPTSVLLLNQVRINPNVTYGNKRYTPGGQAPHFYSSLELMLSGAARSNATVRAEYNGAKFTEAQKKEMGLPKVLKGPVVARWLRAQVMKSKLSANYMDSTDFFVSFERGVSLAHGLVQRLMIEGLVHNNGKGGFKINFEDETLNLGNEFEVISFLRDNREFLDQLRASEYNAPDQADETEADDSDGSDVELGEGE